MPRKIRYPTPRTDAAITWLATARKGARVEYHRGMLLNDTHARPGAIELHEEKGARLDLIELAALMQHEAQQGRVHLIQKRYGVNDYGYWVERKAVISVRQHSTRS